MTGFSPTRTLGPEVARFLGRADAQSFVGVTTGPGTLMAADSVIKSGDHPSNVLLAETPAVVGKLLKLRLRNRIHICSSARQAVLCH